MKLPKLRKVFSILSREGRKNWFNFSKCYNKTTDGLFDFVNINIQELSTQRQRHGKPKRIVFVEKPDNDI